MKNVVTPRTLAQCTFETGYESVTIKEPRIVSVMFAICLFACAGIGAVLYLSM